MMWVKSQIPGQWKKAVNIGGKGSGDVLGPSTLVLQGHG